MQENLNAIFQRELDRLGREIELYTDESKLWEVAGDVKNSGGNLCLHLTGNLQHFIGHHLGNTGYVRQRELEFGSQDVPKTELLAQIATTKAVLNEVLPSLTQQQLDAEFPQRIQADALTTEFMILHLLWHLSYHLGQVNYHRRMISA